MSIPLEPRTDDGAYPAPRRHGIDCNEAGDLIPALALGPIAPAERLLLLAHCETCPDCSELHARSREVVAFLPFSIQSSLPPERAKSALFDRIAQAPTTSAPFSSTATPHHVAIVDSPAAKRSPERDQPTKLIAAEPATSVPTLAWFNNRVGKFAAAPLALALVLASIYGIQVFRGNNDAVDGQVAALVEATRVSMDLSSEPTVSLSQSAVTKAAAVASDAVPAISNPTYDDSTIDTAVNVDDFSTQLVASQPLFTLSARGNGSPTESARAIAPSESMCRMASYHEGQYQLSLSGVALPGGAGEAGIYLKAKNGQKTLIAKITIDAQGKGHATFSLKRPISDFSMLMIGPIEGGSLAARPLNGSMTFSLTSSDQLASLGGVST